MVPTELQERGIEVQGIATDHVKEPRIVGKDAFQQPLSRSLFAFAGTQELDVQGHRQRMLDQVTDDAAVIILDHFRAINRESSLLTLRAATRAAFEEFVAIDGGDL